MQSPPLWRDRGASRGALGRGQGVRPAPFGAGCHPPRVSRSRRRGRCASSKGRTDGRTSRRGPGAQGGGRRARGERGEEAGGGAGGGGAPTGGVRPGTGCHPAAVSLCHRSGLLATATSPAARPPAPSRALRAAAALRAQVHPARRSHTKRLRAARGNEGAARRGRRSRGPVAALLLARSLARRKDARCRGPNTSGKLLEMAPAAATAGDAKPGRALAPAGLLSGRADRGPRGAVPALRRQIRLEKFLHAAFVTPPSTPSPAREPPSLAG